ncbi:unnamed protein product [Rotaria magnacalcarata]|uniref:Uncharacterized protein n=2 Tax=Rotaria magnacalcarata TaxID=392030 RepID=A0A816YJK3_9BILA|nr:unnamed protein product [Rotaria magnacalcarata]CAF2160441.1 unnamed protein product [Rotaria magnacalcarata]CAF3931041.1 unnamed protein product [Rotaria magnacalcarata]CAF4080945.1 unnamed protein product [Rotaria magnacalcarata]
MTRNLSSQSANWIPTSYATTFSSTIPNFEEATPYRVNPEGVKNYVKNRGSLNIGDWAIEGNRMSTTSATPLSTEQESNLPQPKVLGPDALRNYTKSRCSTPNLIYGNIQPPDPLYGMRVKKEGRANYEKNHNTEMKTLLESYGKLSLPIHSVPHTQGELATSLFYTHQEGQMGPIMNNYGHNSATPRPIPHVKGTAAEVNLQKGLGDSQLLQHDIDHYTPTPEPHVKGNQALFNYDMGQGHHVNDLFQQYGKLQQSARAPPKVKYDGVENLRKGQGDSMRKTLSQCPPTTRNMKRPQSVSYWS